MCKNRSILVLALVAVMNLQDTTQTKMNQSKSDKGFLKIKEMPLSIANLIGMELKLKNNEDHLQNNTNMPGYEAHNSQDLKWLFDKTGQRRLPKNDFHNLIDLRNDFDFLINHEACPKSVEILWLVASAPRNILKRRTIRETWGSVLDSRRVLLYFLLGTVNNKFDQLYIEAENKDMGDLIQGNYHDSYRNLTYKHVSALKWFSYYCPLAKFLVKTDDDVFVNSPYLMNYLLENRNRIQDEKQLIWCVTKPLENVTRTNSKWEATVEEYPKEYYPPHCRGFSIIYSGDMVKDLYVEAQKTNYFWIEDIHVTGTLTQQLNISHKPLENMFQTVSKAVQFGKAKFIKNKEYFFVTPNLTRRTIKNLWKTVSKSN